MLRLVRNLENTAALILPRLWISRFGSTVLVHTLLQSNPKGYTIPFTGLGVFQCVGFNLRNGQHLFPGPALPPRLLPSRLQLPYLHFWHPANRQCKSVRTVTQFALSAAMYLYSLLGKGGCCVKMLYIPGLRVASGYHFLCPPLLMLMAMLCCRTFHNV